MTMSPSTGPEGISLHAVMFDGLYNYYQGHNNLFPRPLLCLESMQAEVVIHYSFIM